ncbi:MAG: selenium metabolism-associated LysR family transcriptional regulator, partial [Bacillota bacterium]|nr:selenium metabolism-associated LysR family transcriptional regulator [Bacillota bacterium]
MDFRQLETLAAVVEAGGFSRAAETLYLTQPTITAHINSMEQELGQQLLIRSTKGVQPTEAGRRCYEYAKRTLSGRDQLLAELGGGESPRTQIRIASSTVPAQYLLPELMAAYRLKHPEQSFSLRICDSTEVALRLQEHQADLGFCGSPLGGSDCRFHALASDDLVVICPLCEPYLQLQGEAFPLELLFRAPMICREAGSGTRLEFERWLRERDKEAQLKLVAEMADPQAIKNAVAAGLGLAVLSARSVEDYVRLGKLLSFPLDNSAHRFLYLVRRKKGNLLGPAGDFYDFTVRSFASVSMETSS